MLRGLRWVGLLGVILLLFPSTGAGQKTKDDKKSSDKSKSTARAKADARDKPIVVGWKDGRVTKLDDLTKISMVIKIPVKINNDGKVETKDGDWEWQRTEELIVRTYGLPVQFDAKGRPRAYTRKEKEELRGPDKTLPGYASDIDTLKVGQTVRVYLTKKRSAPRNEVPKITMVLILKEVE
jgi:hypothetical protein